jgi:hypothetical protein
MYMTDFLSLDAAIRPLRESDFVRTTVTIRKDQKKWLREHREYSISGTVQKTIDMMMQADLNAEKVRIQTIVAQEPKTRKRH